jgi:hypothetical protein
MTAKKRGAPKTTVKGMVFSLRGSPEWKAWVEDLASYCRVDVAKLIDIALADLAKARGFGKEAPKR